MTEVAKLYVGGFLKRGKCYLFWIKILKMEEHKKEYNSLRDIVGMMVSFLSFLRKRWLLLLLFVFVGTAIGIFFYFNQKPAYKAESTFILEDKSSSGGGLAGLASQFGFSVGSLGGGGSIFAGDNILEILKSKKVVQQVLLTSTGLPVNNNTLADLYVDFTGMVDKWKKYPSLTGFKFPHSLENVNPIQDSVLNKIYEFVIKRNIIAERTSKQGTIIKVQVISSNALFSRLMAQRLVDEASKLYLNIRVGTAQENINQLQKRSDSLLALLNNKSYRAAASQPLDINPGIRTAIVPLEIANRDKTVLATLYAEVTKNLEASKVLLSQQTPVIQLLDGPGVLLNDHKKGLLLFVAIGCLVAIFTYLLAMFGFFCLDRNPKS